MAAKTAPQGTPKTGSPEDTTDSRNEKTRRLKVPVTPAQLDTTAESLLRAAGNLIAFSELMKALDIPEVEFNGAGLIQPTAANLQKWYRNLRAALAACEQWPDEGLTSVRTTSASQLATELHEQAAGAVDAALAPRGQ